MIAFPYHLVLLARRLALAVLVITLAGAAGARAELRLDITRGKVEPMPIAIANFAGQGGTETQVGRDIAQVVSANLERSGLFRPIDPKALIQDPLSLHNQVRFADLKVINAQALVTGLVQGQPDGRLRVEFRLWDVLAEQQMTGLAYFTVPENWRRVAHIISDAIYKRITGEEGYFDTRIVYISETGPADKRIKRLAIMDQDGENHRFLTDGRTLVLTPRFSPSAPEITYLSYFNNKPRVYLFNIDTGRQEVLGDFPGMTFAPRFSPDGNKVIMSLATSGNSDIYSMDLRTRRVDQLTNSPAIDTSPSYSPDGQRIVFESDRGGTQQLYVMDANGGNPQRITFGQGRYASPVWSPRGDLIAFTKIANGRFHIGVIRPDGAGERLLNEAFHVEGPTWAPNGRVLMFFRERPSGEGNRSRTARLYSVDLTGFNEREVVTPLDASDPAWSPLIP
ncbi:Tol-Pal system beta propeller repeat protein TolB [Skermanella mucosa]|uniref:Tol-Pal system beta propeller repeat protein TolB n=1 Tax=Skermanella mucosa TaxID=1789672 RepID=UPI00192C4B76|nr:Tol-Pal system beta propeller repeat protein TolB [Skermanella mucosa]UEM23194.1 Tol-Pal system beta propeller repeat protein TolB [Skermanella mucosa]